MKLLKCEQDSFFCKGVVGPMKLGGQTRYQLLLVHLFNNTNNESNL